MHDKNARPYAGAESSPTQPSPQTLAAYLAAHPEVSQYQLAQSVGVHQSMISMTANGDRPPGGKLALRLHQATGVPIEALLHPPRRQLKSRLGRRRQRPPPQLDTQTPLSRFR